MVLCLYYLPSVLFPALEFFTDTFWYIHLFIVCLIHWNGSDIWTGTLCHSVLIPRVRPGPGSYQCSVRTSWVIEGGDQLIRKVFDENWQCITRGREHYCLVVRSVQHKEGDAVGPSHPDQQCPLEFSRMMEMPTLTSSNMVPTSHCDRWAFEMQVVKLRNWIFNCLWFYFVFFQWTYLINFKQTQRLMAIMLIRVGLGTLNLLSRTTPHSQIPELKPKTSPLMLETAAWDPYR